MQENEDSNHDMMSKIFITSTLSIYIYIHRTLKEDEQFKIFKFNWHAAIYLLNSYNTLYCFLPTWGQTTGNENL